MIVFSFKNNNKEYVIYEKDKKFYAGINENNIITENLNTSEKILINYIFNKIKVSDELIVLGTLNINNVDYKHLIDTKNGWNIFSRNDNKELNNDEIKYFNNVFNQQKEYLNFSLFNNNETIKRIIKFGKKTIIVFMAANCLVSSSAKIENIDVQEFTNEESIEIAINDVLKNDILVKENLVDDDIEIVEFEKKEETKDVVNQENSINELSHESSEQYDADVKNIDKPQDIILESKDENKESVYQKGNDTEIIKINFGNEKVNAIASALINNHNLKNEDKNFILRHFDIIVDNIEYIDVDYLIDCYSNLTINYELSVVKSLDGRQEDNGQLIVDTNQHEYIINISNASNLEESDQMVLLHELGHTLEGGKYDYLFSHLTESLNSIYNSEYFGYKYSANYKDYDYSYSELKPYIYALSEVFGADMFRRFHFTQDINCIREEMKKTILTTNSGLSEEVYNKLQQDNLIYSLNTLSKRITLNPELEQYQKQVANDFYNVLSEYYMAIYNEPMENNVEIMLQLKPEIIINRLGIEALPESESKKLEIINQKAYFNMNNSNYMKSSKANYYEIYRNGVDILTLEEALNNGFLKENNGEYEIKNENVIKIEEGNVYFKAPYGQRIIEINDEVLEEQKIIWK